MFTDVNHLEKMIRLFAYKQKYDTGFAPNPFHGVCTLATCKRYIRKHKQVGDWIAGFTSNELNGDKVGQERLIFLMQVAEKLPFEKYYTDPRFAKKIPVRRSVQCCEKCENAKCCDYKGNPNVQRSERCIETVGDNIYGKHDGERFQVPNCSHPPAKMDKDTCGEFVLIGTPTFFYFGSKPLDILPHVRPKVPSGMAPYGVQTEDFALAQAFVDYVRSHDPGVRARPHQWKTGDDSWGQE